MAEICGVEKRTTDGRCRFPAKHPDGKCGIHSKHTDTHAPGREIQDSLLREFLAREKDRRGQSTYSNRLTGLRAFDEWLENNDKDPLDVGQMSIEDFAAWLKNGRGLGDGTASKYVEAVSKFYQYVVKWEEEEFGDGTLVNPVEAARDPERDGELPEIIRDPHTSERAKEMKDDTGYRAMSPDKYAEFTRHIQPPRVFNELLFQLLWDTGIRPVEATEIRYEADIDRDDREISIRSEKTHLNRTVFYGRKVATLLDIWLGPDNDDKFAVGERNALSPAETSPYLFVSREREKINTETIEDNFRRTAEAAGLRDEPLGETAGGNPMYELDVYSLRHGFAEKMVDKKIDLETLRDVMGHKNIETTKKYLNPDKETRRNRIQGALDD